MHAYGMNIYFIPIHKFYYCYSSVKGAHEVKDLVHVKSFNSQS